MKQIVETTKKIAFDLFDILTNDVRLETRKNIIRDALGFVKPISTMSVVEWVEANRILPPSSSEPGKFKISRTPFLAEILECMSPIHPARTVIFQKSAQIGGSEALYNSIGYLIDQAPATTLLVLPTERLARESSRGRIAPLIENTKCLREKISESSSKDGGNSIARKEYPGGVFIALTANSAPNLRLIAAKYLFLDEVDGMPVSIDGEGDVMSLLLKRTNTFASERKVMMTSTPLITDSSVVSKEYQNSDQRKYFVPCLHCGEMHILEWQNVVWESQHPETARFKCPGCKKEYGEECKTEMMALGKWVATNEEWADETRRGYHLNALYSPVGWYSLEQAVTEFEASRGDETKAQSFKNTVLGEPYSYQHYRPTLNIDNVEQNIYGDPGVHLPNDVLVLCGSIDQQGDRCEAYVYGFDYKEQMYAIDFLTIVGDPSKNSFWREVENKCASLKYRRADGRLFDVSTWVVDSGGHNTTECYRWWLGATDRKRINRLILGKGVPGAGKPIILLSSRQHKRKGLSGSVKLHNIGVDSGKSNIYGMIEKSEIIYPVYWANGENLDKEYFAQLTSEAQEKVFVSGQAQHRWRKQRNRNEALDCAVYALAAKHNLRVDWDALYAKVGVTETPTLQVAKTRKVSGGDFSNVEVRNTPRKKFKIKTSFNNSNRPIRVRR